MDRNFHFAVASPPCEKFSVHAMKHFFPKPEYPGQAIDLFNHTRGILEGSGIPYVVENVRAAQQFVGPAQHHCGSFYLWGNAVPPLMPQGIIKGKRNVCRAMPDHLFYPLKARLSRPELLAARREYLAKLWPPGSRKGSAARAATIPPELANCVAEYAERICEASVK